MFNVWIYNMWYWLSYTLMFIHLILKVFWGHCRTLYVQICSEPWNAQTIIAQCVMYSVGTYSVIRVLCKFTHSLQNIQCAIFIMHYAVCSFCNIHYTLCSVQYLLCSVQRAMFIMQCAVCNIHYAVCRVFSSIFK